METATSANEAAQRHAADWLRYVLLCLRRYVARYGNRMTQADGRLSDLYVSLNEAFELWSDPDHFPPRERRPAIDGWPDAARADDEIAAHLAGIQQRVAAACGQDAGVVLPIEEVRAVFRLTDLELRLLVAAAAPALSVDAARLYAFAWADFAVKTPTAGFLAELVADTPGDIAEAVACFRPDGALVRHRLVVLKESPSWGAGAPRIHRPVVVPDRVVSLLHGIPEPLPPHLVPGPADAPDAADLPGATVERLRTGLLKALQDPRGRPTIVLMGPSQSGRRTLLSHVLDGTGWGLLGLDLESLPSDPDGLEAGLAEACREALVRRCMLLVRMESLAGGHGDPLLSQERVLKRVLAGHEGPLAVTIHQPMAVLARILDQPFEVALPSPAPEGQRRMWARALAASGCRSDDDLPDRLVRRFDVPSGTIFGAVEEARRRALLLSSGRKGIRIDLDDVVQAVRRRVDHSLGQYAEPFATTLSWDDVVLPDAVTGQLREVLAQARNRIRVLDDWGFRRLLSYGRGLSCLFSGPPGTGKTMMAAVLAADLGRELYRVDLSRVSSKWVGETEKNLARLFDEAERGQVILLFDEADSLFSTRTEVKTSNDRFANMEINYLLQRMEAYDGITILTTNFERALDEAFKRRIRFRIQFPMPDAGMRARLWRAVLPPGAPLAPDIPFDELGERFEMAGGNIKNAALRAAFRAADQGREIGLELLAAAGAEEAREMGILVRPAKD